jgi:hypothetical protein
MGNASVDATEMRMTDDRSMAGAICAEVRMSWRVCGYEGCDNEVMSCLGCWRALTVFTVCIATCTTFIDTSERWYLGA